ncbi:hypothetical protein A9P82_06730 [Arachidicoccus ginsenosidimutans]|uniref:hypothetical protein n=1 Tax=Arachidicoccus sp. BS20 TaxID=1850526 RepID=UPI0007F15046|nr:hypothetical protein [Arachidicoccus sp. BS20]ANI89014.1 hypothetical protein A9P82_06730 [Arachidicoccus sp. BS20]
MIEDLNKTKKIFPKIVIGMLLLTFALPYISFRISRTINEMIYTQEITFWGFIDIFLIIFLFFVEMIFPRVKIKRLNELISHKE